MEKLNINLSSNFLYLLIFQKIFLTYTNLSYSEPFLWEKKSITKIKEYGFFKESTFRLDLSRRAYKIGFLYKPTSESIGIKFNIFNFDYAVIAPRFEQ